MLLLRIRRKSMLSRRSNGSPVHNPIAAHACIVAALSSCPVLPQHRTYLRALMRFLNSLFRKNKILYSSFRRLLHFCEGRICAYKPGASPIYRGAPRAMILPATQTSIPSLTLSACHLVTVSSPPLSHFHESLRQNPDNFTRSP